MTSAHALASGRRSLRSNALTAMTVGAALIFGPLATWDRWWLGLLIGLVYANFFEYAYHRFVLHRPSGRLTSGHVEHHRSWGRDDEPMHVTFGGSILAVVMLFVINSIPLILVEWIWAPGIGAGAAVAFVAYFIAMEEIHWRIHMGSLPGWMERVRRYHFDHHSGRRDNFNVFLPLFDWLLLTNRLDPRAAPRRPPG